MIYVTGDIHGDFNRFEEKELKKLKEGDVLLICGDFGFLWDNTEAYDIPLPRIQQHVDVDLVLPTPPEPEPPPPPPVEKKPEDTEALLASMASNEKKVPITQKPKEVEKPVKSGPPANWDEDETFLSPKERLKKEKREQKARAKMAKEDAIREAKAAKELAKTNADKNSSAAALAAEAISGTISMPAPPPPDEEEYGEIEGSLADAMMGIAPPPKPAGENTAQPEVIEAFADENPIEIEPEPEPEPEPETEPELFAVAPLDGTGNFEEDDFVPKLKLGKKKKAVVAAPVEEERLPREYRDKKDLSWNSEEKGLAWLDKLAKKKYDIAFVDGVYDNLECIKRYYPSTEWKGGMVHKLAHNVVHLQTGQVYRIQGRNFLAIGGGAESSAKPNARASGIPTKEEVVQICSRMEQYNLQVDYIISHQAPSNVIGNLENGTPTHTMLTSLMDALQQRLTFTRWIFGCYHKNRIVTNQYQCIYDKIECIGGRKRTASGKIIDIPAPEPIEFKM